MLLPMVSCGCVLTRWPRACGAPQVENARLEEEKKAAALAADTAEASDALASRPPSHRCSARTRDTALCLNVPASSSCPPLSLLQRESKKKISESKQFQEYKRILKNKSEELKKARRNGAVNGAFCPAGGCSVLQRFTECCWCEVFLDFARADAPPPAEVRAGRGGGRRRLSAVGIGSVGGAWRCSLCRRASQALSLLLLQAELPGAGSRWGIDACVPLGPPRSAPGRGFATSSASAARMWMPSRRLICRLGLSAWARPAGVVPGYRQTLTQHGHKGTWLDESRRASQRCNIFARTGEHCLYQLE